MGSELTPCSTSVLALIRSAARNGYPPGGARIPSRLLLRRQFLCVCSRFLLRVSYLPLHSSLMCPVVSLKFCYLLPRRPVCVELRLSTGLVCFYECFISTSLCPTDARTRVFFQACICFVSIVDGCFDCVCFWLMELAPFDMTLLGKVPLVF